MLPYHLSLHLDPFGHPFNYHACPRFNDNMERTMEDNVECHMIYIYFKAGSLTVAYIAPQYVPAPVANSKARPPQGSCAEHRLKMLFSCSK